MPPTAVSCVVPYQRKCELLPVCKSVDRGDILLRVGDVYECSVVATLTVILAGVGAILDVTLWEHRLFGEPVTGSLSIQDGSLVKDEPGYGCDWTHLANPNNLAF
jgi:hypothetical protein